jgi:hypothetical protein
MQLYDMDVLQQRRARLRSKRVQLRNNPALARLRDDLQRSSSCGGGAGALQRWFDVSPTRVDEEAHSGQVRPCCGVPSCRQSVQCTLPAA